ncbi:MAG: hypothetical protein ABI180_14445 [Microcoleus sp.]
MTSTRAAAIPLLIARNPQLHKSQEEIKGRSRDTVLLATSNTQA